MDGKIVLCGYNGALYDPAKDIILTGIYKSRIVRRSKDGNFWIKIKGVLTMIPNLKIEQAINRFNIEEKIKNPLTIKKANEQRKRSNDAFEKKHGFNRDAFCRWLSRFYSNGLTRYSKLSQIPLEERQDYYDRYKETL